MIPLLFSSLLLSPLASALSQRDLFNAIQRGDQYQVQLALESAPALRETVNQDGVTPLLWALYSHHPELVSLLRRDHALTSFEACALGDTTFLRHTIRRDPSFPNSYSPDGFTPLGLAVFFNHKQTADLLLDAGADPNCSSRNALRVAPLHSAVASANPAMVADLLARKAFVDPVEFLGATPLHAAAAEGKTEIVNLLLRAGADRNKKTKAGKTALTLANDGKHLGTAEVIRHCCPK